MPRASETQPPRPPLFFGLRPRLLGALALTATVTLGVAALALLAPLQSALRGDSESIARAELSGYKAQLGDLAVDERGRPITAGSNGLYKKMDGLAHRFGEAIVVWQVKGGQPVFVHTTDERADTVAPPPVHRALTPAGIKQPPLTLQNGVLVVATRYRGQGYGDQQGRYFVLEVIKHVDYVATANGVVGTAFLYAALVGLAVALILGVALSSRLLRRLRLLRDATRRLDEPDLTAIVVPQDTVSDEIGELAQAFATMHERLRIQEDARRAFVSTASHELRTPLASLDGMLELIEDDLSIEPVDLADARERVTRARIQSRRLASLATDLLDLSRLDARLELRSEPVELGEAARAVAAEFDLRARGRHVKVVLDETAQQSWAQADPGSVARIIRILLDNALQAAPAHSTVEVRVTNGAGPPAIEVVDEGPGVLPDEREVIFERFRRGSGRGPEGGFGLGLAIGSELATRMGGRLELADAAPGATFRLTLPEASE